MPEEKLTIEEIADTLIDPDAVSANAYKWDEEFQKQSLVMTDQARSKKEAELRERIMKFDEVRMRSQQEIQKKEQELILARRTDDLATTTQSIEWMGLKMQSMEIGLKYLEVVYLHLLQENLSIF